MSIIINSTFPSEPLLEVLQLWSEEFSISAEMEIKPGNQVFQSFLGDTAVENGSRQLNIILLRVLDWGRGSVHARTASKEFVAAYTEAAVRSSVDSIIIICPSACHDEEEPLLLNQIHSIEQYLEQELSAVSQTEVIMAASIAAAYSNVDLYDAPSDRLGGPPYTIDFFSTLGTVIWRRFVARANLPIKAIACDCDNTLWSGVVAEDGVDGLRITTSHRRLHEVLLERSKRGVQLWLCSQNDQADVERALASDANLKLLAENTSEFRINWLAKSSNIKALAETSGVALESIIFLDDDHLQCAEVMANAPGVKVLCLSPADAVSDLLDHYWPLDLGWLRGSLGDRMQQRREEKRRIQDAAYFSTVADYVKALGLKLTGDAIGERQIDRVVELMHRTTQFNTSNIKMTAGELKLLIRNKTYEGKCYSLRDRFGDYGLIGAVLISATSNELTVKGLWLSCRALGRGVEFQLLADCGQEALKQGKDSLRIEVNASRRNGPVRDFLNRIASCETLPNGSFCYVIPSVLAEALEPSFEDARSGSASHSIAATTANAYSFVSSELAAANALYQRIAQDYQSAASITRAVNRRHTGHNVTKLGIGVFDTDLEQHLRSIWSEVLGYDVEDPTANFFELGGDSIRAMRVVSRIETSLGLNMPLSLLFQSDLTIRSLARYVEGQLAN